MKNMIPVVAGSLAVLAGSAVAQPLTVLDIDFDDATDLGSVGFGSFGGGSAELSLDGGVGGSPAALLAISGASDFIVIAQSFGVSAGDTVSLSFDIASPVTGLDADFEFRFEPLTGDGAGGLTAADLDGDGSSGGEDLDDLFAFNNVISPADPASLAVVSPLGTADIGDGIGSEFTTITISDFVVPEADAFAEPIEGLTLALVQSTFGGFDGPSVVFIDNIVVTVTPVPAPGAAAVLGLGGLAAFRRRR